MPWIKVDYDRYSVPGHTLMTEDPPRPGSHQITDDQLKQLDDLAVVRLSWEKEYQRVLHQAVPLEVP